MGTPCTNCIDLSGKCTTITTDSIIYVGPDLPCSDIDTKDSLTLIIQKIETLFCTAPGGQDLQTTLLNGNIATDIGAKFITLADPNAYTEVLFNSFSAYGTGTSISLTNEYIYFSVNNVKLKSASTSVIPVNLLLPSKPLAGDYIIATLDDITAGSVFNADIPVVLGGGKTLGKYVNGQTIPAIGKTAQQVITDIALEYIYPVFTSFIVSGQPTTVEVGTTLSGSPTFLWAITTNSGTVPTIDIFDNTAASTLIAGIPNDGMEPVTINTIQLNSDSSTQSWKGIGNNTAPPGIVNSGNFVVTSRFVRWWAPVAAYPVNPADGLGNRTYAIGLSNSAFKSPGVNTFTLVTGTVQNRFIVLLPPGVTITSVIDQTNASTNLTAYYILSPITINDIGGTPRSYNMYQYTNAIPYSVSANHFITTT